ncbi:hypothetical protein O7627_00380 [Solwaraspora sp. WMMD1047]|uniref:hypothetical protein n=1 Tax=Solwaraspora sp. WMMD1047 TaxID=3016102 RepID=UPI0024177AA6|nr:hypothetical protein [Solwaraspora sp. WMMD1047]MDG4827759.1 hypothetical protein [Solwaraspora sp. WMMD1047]
MGGRDGSTPVLRGAARGVIAAMSMSGVRQVTTALGLLPRTPPESVLSATAPALFRRVPPDRRQALVELMHWGYGAAGGVIFGILPRGIRRRAWAGPAYGFLFWAGFEAVLAPALGINRRYESTDQHVALLADHVLYGAVVAASRWPYAD